MRIKRRHVYAIRNAIGEAEALIARDDKSMVAERERDLLTTASCALWEVDLKKVISCLYRLSTTPSKDRNPTWNRVYSMACEFLTTPSVPKVQPVQEQAA